MDVILGINYLSEYNAVLNFEESCLVTNTGQRTIRHEFCNIQPTLITAGIENRMSGTADTPARKGEGLYRSVAIFPGREDEVAQKDNAVLHKNVIEKVFNDVRGGMIPAVCNDVLDEKEYVGDEEIRARNSKVMQLHYVNRGPTVGRYEMNEDPVDNENDIMDYVSPNESPLQDRSGAPDRRVITVPELQRKVEEAGGLDERIQLLDVLIENKESFISKRGKCTLMMYRFDMHDEQSIIGTSRPIPFAVRATVKEQINQMPEDGII
jgi:hypothetical protein